VFPSGYFEAFCKISKNARFFVEKSPYYTGKKTAREECNAAGTASLIVAFRPRGGSEANKRCMQEIGSSDGGEDGISLSKAKAREQVPSVREGLRIQGRRSRMIASGA